MTWKQAVKRSKTGFAYAILKDGDGIPNLWIVNKEGDLLISSFGCLISIGYFPIKICGEKPNWKSLN